MNTMRMGLLCALVGWMAADAQAQWGTYGSPDPIPLGQAAPRDSYAPAAISRASYVAAADGSGPVIPPPPSAALPQPPMSAPGGVPQLPTPTPGNVPQPSMPGPGMVPQPATESNAVMSILNEPGPAFNPAPGCGARPQVVVPTTATSAATSVAASVIAVHRGTHRLTPCT